MLAIRCEQSQILTAIIGPIAIYVMDRLATLKRAVQRMRNYEAVFLNISLGAAHCLPYSVIRSGQDPDIAMLVNVTAATPRGIAVSSKERAHLCSVLFTVKNRATSFHGLSTRIAVAMQQTPFTMASLTRTCSAFGLPVGMLNRTAASAIRLASRFATSCTFISCLPNSAHNAYILTGSEPLWNALRVQRAGAPIVRTE